MSELEFEGNNCKHTNQIEGFCTGCGKCFEDFELQPQRPVVRSHSLYRPSMKFSIQDPMKVNDAAIMKILTPLNLKGYNSSLKNLLLTTTFKYRLKKEDKVIVALYHILKQVEFPIVISDLLKYSNLSKHKLLKIYRDTFEYVDRSRDYLRGIYERVKNFLVKRKIDHSGSFEIFYKLSDIHKCSDPKTLCLAYFLKVNKISSFIVKDIDEYDIYQVQNIRRKLKLSDLIE
ncbi:uncharacterized protein VICG_01521 [Vittaforma corneae ATCC 50505]|uniref:Uncharacterized protein n=1 Tax=Vittaforma corneae (strain ATCC 50505) TaxID=993615 RepID=L2GKN8_VITCO|nr:uncharacterized protein VICG_01521 [Vittaforma corneae ATCC 50505]ELA41416.1 hypothetical protein VICG_01521 [Vittaforma corneae ATCC 50505]